LFSGARQNEVAEACPVTKPPTQPFVPPPPYWRDHDRDQFWYGTESLWTLLGATGTWNISGNVLESENAYRTKLTYWRRAFDSQKDKPANKQTAFVKTTNARCLLIMDMGIFAA
jgi:hypothetical protein